MSTYMSQADAFALAARTTGTHQVRLDTKRWLSGHFHSRRTVGAPAQLEVHLDVSGMQDPAVTDDTHWIEDRVALFNLAAAAEGEQSLLPTTVIPPWVRVRVVQNGDATWAVHASGKGIVL